jgi:hypothetical protein
MSPIDLTDVLCSTLWMSAVVASLIAVAGTLLGSFSTYSFQQKVAQRAEASTRQERLRQDRLVACSGFAAAITDLRRAVIAVWFRERRRHRAASDQEHATTDYRMAYTEADRLGAAAEAAMFQMLLVLDDPDLRELADGAFKQVGAVHSAEDKADVEILDVEFEAHMSKFVTKAGQLLR